MPGTWTVADITDPGQRPGLYSRFMTQATVSITGGTTGVVGVVAITDEGPLGSVTRLETLGEYEDTYGDTVNNTYRAVRNIFQGGASAVLFCRVDREEEITLEGASSTDSIELTSRNIDENSLTAVISVSTVVGEEYVTLSLTNDSNPVPGQSWTTTVVNGTNDTGSGITLVAGVARQLVDMISDDESALVVADLVGDGTVTNVNTFADASPTFTIGDNNYTGALDIIGSENFGVLYVDLSPNQTDWSLVESKVDDLIENDGKYVQWVTGSRSNSTIARANSDASGLDNEETVFIHPGYKVGTTIYPGYLAAARVAGMLASLSLADSLTYRPVAGADDVITRYGNTDVMSLIENGVCPLVYDGRNVKIERGNNTLITIATGTQNNSFKKIKVIRILNAINNALNMSIADQVVGRVANDPIGQSVVRGAIRVFLRSLSESGVVLPNFSVRNDPNNVSSEDRYFVRIGVQPIDSIEFVYTTIAIP